MSFQTNIASIMTSDAVLNLLVEDICFDILPLDFELTKDWIVYNYRESERIDVMVQKNVLTKYSLYVKIVSSDTNNLLTITDEVNSYLTKYTDSNVLDIAFVNDNHNAGIVDDKDIFENTIEYTITYKN